MLEIFQELKKDLSICIEKFIKTELTEQKKSHLDRS